MNLLKGPRTVIEVFVISFILEISLPYLPITTGTNISGIIIVIVCLSVLC